MFDIAVELRAVVAVRTGAGISFAASLSDDDESRRKSDCGRVIVAGGKTSSSVVSPSSADHF